MAKAQRSPPQAARALRDGGLRRAISVSSIDASFRRAIADSTLFKDVLDRVRQLAMGEEGKASDPVVLAATVYEALTATNPKPAYSLRPDLARSALEYLPARWADRLLQRVLSTARPKA